MINIGIDRQEATQENNPIQVGINPLMPIGNYSCQFNICCPRDSVSRHNGGTSVPPLNPSESIVFWEHYRLWGV